MDEAFWTIQAKLRKRTLRQDEHEKTWAGAGTGKPCDGCDLPILETHIEIEADFSDRQTLHFHMSCFNAWYMQARELRRPSESS